MDEAGDPEKTEENLHEILGDTKRTRGQPFTRDNLKTGVIDKKVGKLWSRKGVNLYP